MKTLVFATNNKHKLQEVRQILGERFDIKSLADIGCEVDIPETADTLEGNAMQKAKFVKEHYGLDCFADDTGLECRALDGAPGIYSARYAGDSAQLLRYYIRERSISSKVLYVEPSFMSIKGPRVSATIQSSFPKAFTPPSLR